MTTGLDLIAADRAVWEEDFPLLKRKIDDHTICYLDNAATSLTPVSVVAEMSRYYLEVRANIHRGKHYLSEEASTYYEEARYKVARLVNAAGNEIVFTRNSTEGLNIVAEGLGLQKSDVVVVCTDSHHSNYLPWLSRADARMVRANDDGSVDVQHFAELLRAKPKVVSLTHCSNVTGLYAPLKELVPLARAAGAIVVLDAAQSVPHQRVDVRSCDVDFMVFSAHKMLGPTGLGVLYGRRDLLEGLQPTFLGGGMVDWVEPGSYRPRKIPHRFEAGTPHIAGVYGMSAAIDYLDGIGFDALSAHDHAMGRLLLEEAASRTYLQIIGNSPTERCGLLSLRVRDGGSLGDLARMLSDSYGIMCRTGHMCAQPLVDRFLGGEILRVSSYFYNSRLDVRRFFSALDEVYPLVSRRRNGGSR